MKNELNEKAEYILRKGRMHLIMNHPFWGELALRLKLVPSPWCPTTAVDAYGRFYYNPAWVATNFAETEEAMTTIDAMFEFAHEIGHLMFRHHARRPAGAIPSVWNLAGDQIIDTHMKKEGLQPSAVSKKMLTDEIYLECLLPDGKVKTTEQRYYELEKKLKDCPACRKLLDQFKKQVQKQQDEGQNKPQEPQQDSSKGQEQPGSGQDGHSHGDHGQECDHENENDHGNESQGQGNQPGADSKEWNGIGHICKNPRMCCSGSMSEADSQTVEEWKQHIASAAKTAKMKGNCPAIGKDFLTELERPSRDWRDIIRAQASEVYRHRYSQKRSARRSHAIGIKLPGRIPKPLPPVVAMDCSGSIAPLASRFASEIVGILSAAGAPEVLLMFHDVVVYHMDYFDKDDLHKLKVSNGGTSHRDVFEKLKDIVPHPGMLICFTDLYSDQMELDNPGIPVIWVTPEGIGTEMEIPFGKRVEVTNDSE